MGEKKTKVILCVLGIFVLSFSTISQALIQNNSKESLEFPNPFVSRAGSIEVWEDEFLNQTKIDFNFSNHVIVNTTIGTVSMENTYPAWTNPSFTRMKKISILNSGQETFENYDIHMMVSYEWSMQIDFDDLRFTDQTGNQLPYYRYNAVNGMSCEVLIGVPLLPPGETTIYMFYGNPSASSQSSFSSVFSWEERTSPDTMVSFKAATEGAWDPSVIYGADRFLVTWEERAGPEDINVPLPNYQRTLPGVIHGRTYDKNGADPNPTNNSDIDVSDPNSDTYHAENPCNAFGAGNYFVVWEENPANQPLYRYEADIKGALVTPSGTVSSRFTICSATGGQYEPQVAYDSQSNRFLVIWADARYGVSDYDVRGRLYNHLGYPIAADFPIAYEANYQGNPWLSCDNEGHFFIVYEDGPSASLGPFSLYAYRVDSNGNHIGSRITIAVGTDTVDNIFPAVSYNENTNRYLVTWNDGDVSVDPSIRDSYNGNIWGKMFNKTGAVIKNNYIIEPGLSFIRSVSVPYFDSMFFVVYDGIIVGNHDLWGRLIASNGTVMTSRHELSDGSSQNVDWNDIAVGAGRVFVTWEDERDLVSQYADVFEYVWRSAQSIGSSNITFEVGSEIPLITQAQLMSIAIQPEMFREWREVFFDDELPGSTSIMYDIVDENATMVLKADVHDGENISDVNASVVRLRATFTRASAQHSPVLEKWNISAFVGKDIYPPSTDIILTPSEPNGNNNWYVTPVTVDFIVSDVDSDPENITTYYDINGFGVEMYDPETPPVISSERPDNYIEFWSNDSINEELPHQYVQGIHIDTTPPLVTLNKPSDIIPAGTALINGSATEYSSGSGIDRVVIELNEETIYDTEFNGESRVWFDRSFIADLGETYDIFVKAWDKAGNLIQERRTVFCPDYGVYETGYIYWFNNPKIGPSQLLVSFGLSIAVNNDTLYVVLPDISSETARVEFVATQAFLKQHFHFNDTDLSDGCSAHLLLPLGIYGIKAYAYDAEHQLIKEYTIITKMLIILLK
jgi:hypothetical protein